MIEDFMMQMFHDSWSFYIHFVSLHHVVQAKGLLPSIHSFIHIEEHVQEH